MRWTKYIPKPGEYRIKRRFAWLPQEITAHEPGSQVTWMWLGFYWELEKYPPPGPFTPHDWYSVSRHECHADAEVALVKAEHEFLEEERKKREAKRKHGAYWAEIGAMRAISPGDLMPYREPPPTYLPLKEED